MAAPAPCGTTAAAKRHRRRGEPLDEACLQAERDEANGRNNRKRAESVERVKASMPTNSPDRAEVLDEVLQVLRAQLLEAPPQSVAAIAKQVRETAAEIAELNGASPAMRTAGGLSDIARAYREKRSSA